MSTTSPNFALDFPEDAAGAPPSWKQELNERLAANRARRSRRLETQTMLPGLEELETKAESRASRLAAKVAERYANAPSYSEILAAEARDQARAKLSSSDAEEGRSVANPGAERRTETASAGLAATGAQAQRAAAQAVWSPVTELMQQIGRETQADVVEEAIVAPSQPLPANLIEFPRELVAARKARPRLEEGPLRETVEEANEDFSQLQIFEVDSETISKAIPAESAASAATEWSSIRLDARPTPARAARAREAVAAPLQAAPLEDRLMAGIFDLALVLVAFTLFILVFVACTTHPPTGKPALFGAAFVLLGLFLLYEYIFFRFAESTPGMYYAKIALCTFDDENPTREAMRSRILCLLLSAAPLGLGFAWAWFDNDRLGWHDRMTRMYQRSYRQ